jgi:hypothetical protein
MKGPQKGTEDTPRRKILFAVWLVFLFMWRKEFSVKCRWLCFVMGLEPFRGRGRQAVDLVF